MNADDVIYVVLQPQSQTNHTDKYRVVEDKAWFRYVNGVTQVMPFSFETDDYNLAVAKRDELNNG